MSLPLTTRLARRLRHLPGLHQADQFWRILRPVYHWCLDPFGRGVALEVGHRVIRLPAALLATSPDWSAYESTTLERMGSWLDRHPDSPLLLDIGSSYGVMTSFALQINPNLRVIAFDSDATSLRAMEAVVPRSAHIRLQRVLGLLGTDSTSNWTLAEAAAQSRLPQLSPRAAINRSTYVCLGDPSAGHLPCFRLDDLLRDTPKNSALLIKCDVEGAELLVLQGGKETILRHQPVLIISVHPALMPRHGHKYSCAHLFACQPNQHRGAHKGGDNRYA